MKDQAHLHAHFLAKVFHVGGIWLTYSATRSQQTRNKHIVWEIDSLSNKFVQSFKSRPTLTAVYDKQRQLRWLKQVHKYQLHCWSWGKKNGQTAEQMANKELDILAGCCCRFFGLVVGLKRVRCHAWVDVLCWLTVFRIYVVIYVVVVEHCWNL